MKQTSYIYGFILSATIGILSVCSCIKEEAGTVLPYITFGVTDVAEDTKALITNETLNSSSTSVTVYGVRNNTEQIFKGVTIKKRTDSYNWEPENSSNKRVWSSGSYSFYGYTFSSGQTACTVQKDGLKIIVTQPASYSETNMVDYMLSHTYKVADGTSNHIVMLYMQHAMACAEIIVKKQIHEHEVTLKSISLNGIYRSATMECEDQANANSGEYNVWKTQISGDADAQYTKEFTPAQAQGNTLGTMTILAVPQQLTQATELTVVYSVDEDNNDSTDPIEYTDVFKLFDYTPYVWESGHKIRYTLNINTGVELQAEIVDWIAAGYIEGVIFPSGE